MSKGYKSFHTFLNTCLYQTVQMKMVKYLHLPKDEDTFMSAHSSCLLDKDFFEKYTERGGEAKQLREKEMELAKIRRKKKRDERKNKLKNEKNQNKEVNNGSNTVKIEDVKLSDKESKSERESSEFSYDDSSYSSEESSVEQKKDFKKIKKSHLSKSKISREQVELMKRIEEERLEAELELLKKNQKKQKEAGTIGLTRCNVQAVEFDWIFDDRYGRKFLVSLANTKDTDIFSVPIIKNIVMFMWRFYRIAIAKYVMIPFIFYFIAYVVYATWIKKGKDDNNGGYKIIDYVFCVLLLIAMIYFMYIEIRQILYYKLRYFQNFWNLIDVSSLMLNMFCVISDLVGLNQTKHIPVLACSVLIMWLKLMYFGRMFLSTAWMIRMMIGTVVDLKWFIVVFFLMVVGFSDCIYIISKINQSLFAGTSFDKAFEYTYQTVVGAFDVSVFPNDKYKVEILILWLICTFIIFIVMLNMLIALINDIFAKIYQNINNNMLQELAVLMVESELLISRANLFYGRKYIIVVTKEKADDTAADVTSQLGMMKSSMNKKLKEQTRVLLKISDNLENKIDDTIDKKVNDLEFSTTKNLKTVSEKVDEIEVMLNQYKPIFDALLNSNQ